MIGRAADSREQSRRDLANEVGTILQKPFEQQDVIRTKSYDQRAEQIGTRGRRLRWENAFKQFARPRGIRSPPAAEILAPQRFGRLFPIRVIKFDGQEVDTVISHRSFRQHQERPFRQTKIGNIGREIRRKSGPSRAGW